MQIAFKRAKLSRIFNSEETLYYEYGSENGQKIRNRMAVLEAAPTLAEVPHAKPERRHELKGRRKGQFAVDLKYPYRLVFRPEHDPVPRKRDGGIDLNEVTAIVILGVEDYHR